MQNEHRVRCGGEHGRHARPAQDPGELRPTAKAKVTPGEFLEIEPDIFGVIVGVNGAEAKRLAADLED